MTEKKATALIVEDEAPIALGLQGRLQRMGYSVCGVAFSGEEALRLIGRYQPDIILADINLIGDMDGVEVITQLRQTSPTPVVFISAYPSGMYMERLVATEPYEYLVKPIKDEALRNALIAALARR